MKTRIGLPDVLIVLVLLGVVAATLYPFIYMAAVSLSDSTHILKGDVTLWPKGFNLDTYKVVLHDPRISNAYLNTIQYVLVGTFVSLIITAAGAFAISKKELPHHKLFTLLIVFTMFFSGGMIPTFLVVKSYGLVDSLWSMVLPTAVSTWNLIVMRTFFAAMPKEVEESGKIDGLTDIGIFFRLVLPLSKAVLATIGLFYAVGIWNNFYSALLYLRNQDLFPLQVVLRNIVLQGQVNSANVTAVGGDTLLVDDALKFTTILVSTVPILLVYPFLQKYFVKGVMIGSVKG
ncbi:carbohydrate ABC transporter permease [Paenibacillus whitsoniae]|uniref:Carbohydrate ABC transporter permease n=1 Tax=Paenibacillus whitsoniae TaxID=2496558 RepID=A0A3S0C5T4_9BACL|nr:carbohydrate ABC transporter permease [Paenibacillus whitsoniae]RTE04413.1 carbohydrate ABC transporter permease [Paenibacillus whitsoniae]